MNDLQLLAQIAGMLAQNGKRVDDAIDTAESIVYRVIERKHKHDAKHLAAPAEKCFYCDMRKLIREADARVRIAEPS
jgi:hypothetical protein